MTPTSITWYWDAPEYRHQLKSLERHIRKKNTQRLHNKKRKTRKKREGTSKSCVDDPSAILKIMSERMDPENNIFWELMSNNFIVEKTM